MDGKKEKDLKEWSSRRFQKEIQTEITGLFENILDFSEVAIGDEKRYKALRSKILRLGNNAIRNLVSKLTEEYDIEYTKIAMDEVKVKVKVNKEVKNGR